MFAHAAERALTTDAIPSVTHKLSIGYGDMYVKIGWVEGRPVHLDVTIASAHRNGASGDLENQAHINELHNRLIETARASMEISCRMASTLLRSGEWTLDHLISSWSATKFEPSGPCKQLSRIVSSPMDAVAALCAQRKDIWEEEFRNAAC